MSRRLPSITSRNLIGALERANFYIHHVQGSHCALRHLLKPNLRVTVPYHNKDLNPSTVRSILKQAGMSVEDLIDLL